MIVLTFAQHNVDQAGSEKWPEKTRDWLEVGEQAILLVNQCVTQKVFKSAEMTLFGVNTHYIITSVWANTFQVDKLWAREAFWEPRPSPSSSLPHKLLLTPKTDTRNLKHLQWVCLPAYVARLVLAVDYSQWFRRDNEKKT